MEKMLVVNPNLCTACRICELVCSFKCHGEFNPAKSRIKITFLPRDFFYYPNVCSQCTDAPCVKVCPVNALKRISDISIVELDKSRCIGCKLCMQACPFGAMGFNTEEGVSEKCNLCEGDPECVKYCFFGALEYKEPEVAMMHKSKALARCIKNNYYIYRGEREK